MDKIARIRQEIERNRQAIRVLNEHTAPEQMSKTCAIFQYSDSILSGLNSFIDTLSEESDKGLDVTDFCKPIDPGIAQCVADHWWELLEDKEPDKSLEEAAEKSSAQYYKDAGYSPFPNVETAAHKSGFIAGADWKEKQMMKDAVEAIIIKSYNPCTEINKPSTHGIEVIYEDENKPYLLAGDKVRIIIVKEDEK